ncbi:MAG: SRPBCC family protein [Bacteroides sp.]|nr:hypothetical protein [Roseburia sp.]MCM1346411.1 SRPBCC family protein [Bacteroides sp.]MCM1420979.1 SRPBCC family protein [Bacteroides sp.]
MSKFESDIKQIPYPQSNVFAKLSDMSNLSAIREKLNNTDEVTKTLKERGFKEEDINKLSEQFETMEFDRDSASINIPPVGNIALRIIEREPDKCIKFESTNSPIGFKMWIQLLPVTETSCKMRLTIDASLSMFIKPMVSKPLTEGVNKLADMLAVIPYEG